MHLGNQIEQAAVHHFVQVMKLSPPDSRNDVTEYFKVEMTIKVDGETKLLLIFGKTHPYFGDGQAYAVLNPSAKLIECVNPCYSHEKSAFVGECDYAAWQWVNTNGKEPQASVGYRYQARKKPEQPAL